MTVDTTRRVPTMPISRILRQPRDNPPTKIKVDLPPPIQIADSQRFMFAYFISYKNFYSFSWLFPRQFNQIIVKCRTDRNQVGCGHARTEKSRHRRCCCSSTLPQSPPGGHNRLKGRGMPHSVADARSPTSFPHRRDATTFASGERRRRRDCEAIQCRQPGREAGASRDGTRPLYRVNSIVRDVITWAMKS